MNTVYVWKDSRGWCAKRFGRTGKLLASTSGNDSRRMAVFHANDGAKPEQTKVIDGTPPKSPIKNVVVKEGEHT